jgi:hypothetical protein
MAKKRSSRNTDPVASSLEDIKRLLMLQLLASGVQAQSIGKVLGLKKPEMSKMLPARALKLPKAA